MNRNQILQQRLILVRQMYLKAEHSLESAKTYAEKVIALISFDLAVETALKIVTSNLSKPLREPKFPELIAAVCGYFEDNSLGQFPDESYIQKVHKLRNFAQHEAEPPTDKSLSDCRTYTYDFLEKLYLKVWDLDFSEISLLDLIRNAELKKSMYEVNAQIDAGDFTEACFSGKIALEQLVASLKNRFAGDDAEIYYPGPLLGGSSAATHQFQLLVSEINSLKGLILLPLVGIDPSAMSRYNEITKGLLYDIAYSQKVTKRVKREDCTREEAEFVRDFVINFIIKAEATEL